MSADDFAEVISGTWGRSETWRDWFQVRSWCYGAAIMANSSADANDIRLLQKIAAEHQHELEFNK